ncbi:MAG: PIG-L family deacetylase, partial [Candidatus Omnitrophota bacterium]
NVFIDISETVDAKLKAMECYVSELKEFPHPRSLEAIRINSKAAGMKAGLKHAEQFVLVRTVI